MRIDDLRFEYKPDIFGFIADHCGIDLVIQPLRGGFAVEIVDGIGVHPLGSFPSERWAKVAALKAAEKVSGRIDGSRNG